MTTSIQSKNSTQSAILVNGVEAAVFDAGGISGIAGLNGGQLAGMRNRIINGDMRIDQRNAGAVVTINNAGSSFCADRWFGYGHAADGVFTLQVVADAPPNFLYSLKATVTAADASIGAAQIYKVEHRVEGFNVIDFGSGTASAKQVIASFWVKCSVTGTFNCTLGNNVDLSCPSTYTILSANTWEYKTAVFQLPTAGTWNKVTGVGMMVTFPLGAGATYKGAANTWGNYIVSATGSVDLISTVGATFQVTGVQLELGSVATPFEHRPYGLELALCQRYYQTHSYYAPLGCFNGGNQFTCSAYNLPVTMRTNPTVPPALTSTPRFWTLWANTAVSADVINTFEAMGSSESSITFRNIRVAGNNTPVGGYTYTYEGWFSFTASAEL